jgi:hypothetical protein
MASLTLPPAPANPRQDAIDLHKAFKGTVPFPSGSPTSIALLDKDRIGAEILAVRSIFFPGN